MRPLTLIFPARLPMSAEESTRIGMSLATGFPCLVITMPSGPTRSRSPKHCALNCVAATVFTGRILRQVRIHVHFADFNGLADAGLFINAGFMIAVVGSPAG